MKHLFDAIAWRLYYLIAPASWDRSVELALDGMLLAAALFGASASLVIAIAISSRRS